MGIKKNQNADTRKRTEVQRRKNLTASQRRRRKRKRERLTALLAAGICLTAVIGAGIGIGIYVRRRVAQGRTEPVQADVAQEYTTDGAEELSEDAAGEQDSRPEPTMIQAEYEGLPYCLIFPSSMEADESYPAVLFLHGAGERGDDNALQLNDTGIVPFLTEESFYAQHPGVIIAPQCPEGEQWVDTPWEDGSYSLEEVPVSEEMEAVAGLLEQTCREYPVDRERLYIAGVSMGGYGAWDMLMRHPEEFAGAVILCGAGDPSLAAEIKDVPVWVFHGDQDEEIPVSGSREMVTALEEAGVEEIHYTEYEGVGHWIWMIAYEEDGLLDWLFAQRRQ